MVQRERYRPDIDGLRAIAVLSVIVFHLSKRLLPGGFVGVDVFFVISGFLITGHIVHDLDRGSFSVADFYTRRIKRIAPAMLVVVAVTLLAAKLLMLPEDAVDASKSGVYSLASLANVYFWRNLDTSYFATQGRDVPLLHLWSLGVEEQFYILWPLVLMALYSANRSTRFMWGMGGVALASFALGNVLFPSNPSFTYYMLPTRAGELLMGALATNPAVTASWARLPQRVVASLSVVAIGALAWSLAFLSETHVFPGLIAIVPTAAAAVLLLSRDSFIARALGWRPLVAIGLVSYSAYLWHWPLLTFFRYAFGDPNLIAGACLLTLTFFLAWASYRWVEQPARRSTSSFAWISARYYLVPSSVIGSFALVVIYAGRVWPSLDHTDYRQQLATLREQARPAYEYSYVCQRGKLELVDLTDPQCVLGPTSDGEPSIVLWGDSNAAHYVGILGSFARSAGFRFRNIEIGSCPPLLDPTAFVEAKHERDCVASLVMARPAVDRASVLILGADWPDYAALSGDHTSAFLDRVFATVRHFIGRGTRVILLGKAPIIDGFDRKCREKALAFPFMRCPVVRQPLPPRVIMINAALKQFADHTPGVTYYDANAYLCPNGVCSTTAADGDLLFYDPGHLSLTGSWKIGAMIVREAGVPEQFTHLWMTTQ